MTQEQRDRMVWLQHCLADTDTGQLMMTLGRRRQLQKELAVLEELAQKEGEVR